MTWGIAWSRLEAIPLTVQDRQVVAERRPDLGPDIFEYRRKSSGLLIFLRAGDGMPAPADVTAELTADLRDALAASIVANIAERRGQARRRRRSGSGEPHRPVGALTIRDLEGGSPNARVLSYAVRRIVDERLWRGLSDLQQRAAVDLNAAFQAALGGSPAAPMGERVDMSISPKRFEPVRFDEDYLDWAQAAEAQGISAAAVIDVVCFGKTRREVARERRKRALWVKSNLLQGLDLYALIKGWVRQAVDNRAGTKL